MDQSACKRYEWLKKNSDDKMVTFPHPYHKMVFQKKIWELLPSTITPVIINCWVRNWHTTYNAELKRLFEWKNIADMYMLKLGDVCVFELTENSTRALKFRPQIIRGELPPELLKKAEGRVAEGRNAESRTGEGQTAESAIVIN